MIHDGTAVAERIADRLVRIGSGLPDGVVETARKLFVDVAGLCVAARRTDYVGAVFHAVDAGPCSALGHGRGLDAFGAALVNGTAAHGEDYDDTFEGGPVHSGAVVIPSVLAACEREGLGGERLLLGIATGAELLCRLSLVAPKAIHKAGFHPTAVLGAVAAAGGVGAALGLGREALVSALGSAGSMASGLIEYLTEGTWTKRMHAGWAAQSGLRAALLARGGFLGPRTVFEGAHGLFHGFAPARKPDFAPLLEGLGERWAMETVAFKPYPCGTMIQPYIDCALALAERIALAGRTALAGHVALAGRGVCGDDVESILCETAEGIVHRLWEPLAVKHAPPTPYAAEFSIPFCIALALLDRKVGLGQFTEERIRDPAAQALAAKVRYVIDPANPYPDDYTGHLRATLRDGTVLEMRQPHLRGGVRAPLSTAEIEAKFLDNVAHGGWSRELGLRLIERSRTLFAAPDLAFVAEFRA